MLGIDCTRCEVHSQNKEHAPFECEFGLNPTVGFVEVTGEALSMQLPSNTRPTGLLTHPSWKAGSWP